MFGKESDGLDLELPIGTLLYEPKRNDLLKHLTAKTHEVPEGSGDTKNTDTNSTDFSSPGIDNMNEASEIKCKKKLLGLLASWVRLTTCSSLVQVRILLRKLVNSKVWNIILSNNISGHCLHE